MKQIHQDNTLQLMYDNHVNVSQTHARYDDVVIYDDWNEINDCIKNNAAISGVSLNGNEPMFCVIVKLEVRYDLFQIIFDDSSGFHKCNQWYTPINIESSNFLSFVSIKELIDKIFDYIMMIPLTTNDGNNNENEFTVISKNWMCRKYDNTMSTFEPSKNILEKIIEK